jgi:hypothetical protein
MSEFLSSIDGGTDLLMRFRYEMPVDLQLDDLYKLPQPKAEVKMSTEDILKKNNK